MIWDEGTYDPEVEVSKGVRREVVVKKEAEDVAERSLAEGNLKFQLYGKKLRGSFALVRTAGFGGKESWLLIKHRDEYSQPGYDANDYDFSAVSKRTLAQIAGQEELAGPQDGLNRKRRSELLITVAELIAIAPAARKGRTS